MTAVVAITDGNTVFMGGDRATTGDDCIVDLPHPKVWRRGGVTFGCAGQVAQLQRLRYEAPFPRFRGGVPDRYVGARLAPALRKFFGSEDIDIDILIGVRGRLFALDCVFSFTDVGPEWAIGSGGAAARAALACTTGEDDPQTRIAHALNVATLVCNSVRGPFDFVG